MMELGLYAVEFVDLEVDCFVEVDICELEADRGQGIKFGYYGEVELCWKA
jgi:hypothetical protein